MIGSRRLLFITTDLLCIPDVVYRGVVQGLLAAGLAKEEEVCLSASHTHSGPEMKDNLMVANIADDYNKKLIDDILKACREATLALVPAEIKAATGKVDFLMNRRKRSKTAMIDERVLAIHIQDLKHGKSLAVLFGVGCHAVTLGHDNLQISADFPGVAQKTIEEMLAVENALFVNLTEGNVIPESRGSWDSLDTRGYLGGTFADAERIGQSLGRACAACRKGCRYNPTTSGQRKGPFKSIPTASERASSRRLANCKRAARRSWNMFLNSERHPCCICSRCIPCGGMLPKRSWNGI
jgi:hypothetical protein